MMMSGNNNNEKERKEELDDLTERLTKACPKTLESYSGNIFTHMMSSAQDYYRSLEINNNLKKKRIDFFKPTTKEQKKLKRISKSQNPTLMISQTIKNPLR